MGTELGPGETEVLALGMEHRDAILIIDDAVARQAAGMLGLRFTGTLGLLIDAKKTGFDRSCCAGARRAAGTPFSSCAAHL